MHDPLNPQQTYILVTQLVVMIIAFVYARKKSYAPAFLLSVIALLLSFVNLLL